LINKREGERLSLSSAVVSSVARQQVIIVRETKSSGGGILLSFLWTGLGQLYAGEIARGLVMMTATPIIWIIGWFGGIAAFFGGLGTVVAPTSQESASAAGVGFFGFVMALIPGIWWLWGMIDAKQLCENFNRRITRSL
jgi:hypothetical protein